MTLNHLSSSYQLDIPSFSLEARVIPWDTALLGFPVGQIDHLKIKGDIPPMDALSDFRAWRDGHGLRMLSYRTNHDDLTETMFLESHGFCFVEMVFQVVMTRINVTSDSEIIMLRFAVESDLDAIQSIAKNAFSTGRFNIDPRLGERLGGLRYAGWILNSFSNPKHQIIKACIDDKIVGFFIVENTGQGMIYWHLTAIAPEWQGQGVGYRVWQAMMIRHHKEGIKEIKTTISARNIAVINLYAKLGFRFESPMMTFHWIAP